MTQNVRALIDRIRSPDEIESGAAWQSAGRYGAAAVKPLGELMTDPDFELARKAKRALYRVVRYSGYPWAGKQRAAVERELIRLLKTAPAPVRRDIVWMLSEIGSRRAVSPIAALLTDKEVREDARCALTRHADPKAITALRSALATAPEDFKYALAESLRQLGQVVEGYPSRKLVPSAQTTVKPIELKSR